MASVKSVTRKMLIQRRLRSVLFYALVLIILIIFVFPIFWMLLTSLKGVGDVVSSPPKLIFRPTLANYQKILNYDLLGFFKNSIIIGLGSSFLALLLGLPAAYSIARFRQGRLSRIILVARILPMMSVLLPWFVFFTRLGLTDTYVAVILAHLSVTLPLTIWIMIAFFEDIPNELEDAALVDGCNKVGVFWRVSLRLARPGIVVGFLLSFIFSWNNFLMSSILGAGEVKTLPVVAFYQISWFQTDIGGMAASGIVLTMPVLILTLFVQRHLVKGLTLGALKG